MAFGLQMRLVCLLSDKSLLVHLVYLSMIPMHFGLVVADLTGEHRQSKLMCLLHIQQLASCSLQGLFGETGVPQQALGRAGQPAGFPRLLTCQAAFSHALGSIASPSSPELYQL